MRKLIFILFLFVTASTRAQDTLTLSLAGADSIFISNNLMLLAARYKVDASKALIQQARLWGNPTLSTEWNLYNPDKDKFFDAGKNGQKIIGLEQVVSLAGKRNKLIQLAKANAQFSQFEFYELMRALKTELHNSYYAIYFSSQVIEKLDKQVVQMGVIIEAMEVQSKKGNIPLKEVLRLKALYYQLNHDRAQVVSDLFDAQQTLLTLLQVSAPVKVIPSQTELDRYSIAKLDLKSLLDKALTNRPDLKMTENLSQQADLNYSLQKRLTVPDLHIGAVYDQAGSYVNNYSGITLGFDLPVFNRNQGNIKYAKAVSGQYKAEVQNKTNSVSNEVSATYQKLKLIEESYRKVDADFGTNIELLNEGYLSNFQKRNISMIEFTDFFEAYNTSIQELNKLKEKRIQTYEELNYVIGEELFR